MIIILKERQINENSKESSFNPTESKVDLNQRGIQINRPLQSRFFFSFCFKSIQYDKQVNF